MNEIAKKLTSHEDVLNALADAINVPPSKFDLAVSRYQGIGAWLDREGSGIRDLEPRITPQGSFRLGTAIKPVNDVDEYDVDLVCTLRASKQSGTMRELKQAVGREVKSYAQAQNMSETPEDGRRCWTLNYQDIAGFHVDVLPAIPDVDGYRAKLDANNHFAITGNARIANGAIAITDKKDANYDLVTSDWPVSNPEGYAVWFNSRQQAQINNAKHSLFAEGGRVYASVDDIPDYRARTVLQKTVQLLKRHRDAMFDGADDKPISIIITTLAAQAYTGQDTIVSAMKAILPAMTQYIEDRNGELWVSNPVNPDENFADKWTEKPAKQANFFKWLEQAQRDFGTYLNTHQADDVPDGLRQSMTDTTFSKIAGLISVGSAAPSQAGQVKHEVDKVKEMGNVTKPWRR